MSLDRFMKKKRPSLVVEDMSNLMYRTVFTAHKGDPLDKNYTLWKYMMVERLLSDLLFFKADRCIIAMDDKNYWRKDIYADYKNKRKSNRQKSTVDFDEFFKVAFPFIEELQTIFPNIMFLKVNKCEADDIIAVLTKQRWKDYNVMCISNDSDLKQLYKFKHYKQYDPIHMKIYQPINSEQDLLVKILTGDTVDDIPNVAPLTGPVKALKMINEGLDSVFKKGVNIKLKGVSTHIEGRDIKSNFKRNKQLIDLELVPQNYQKKILEVYDTCVINKYNGRKMFNFLIKHRMKGLIEDLEIYSKTLVNLS